MDGHWTFTTIFGVDNQQMYISPFVKYVHCQVSNCSSKVFVSTRHFLCTNFLYISMTFHELFFSSLDQGGHWAEQKLTYPACQSARKACLLLSKVSKMDDTGNTLSSEEKHLTLPLKKDL